MRKTRNAKGIIYRIFNSGAYDKVLYLVNEKGEKESMLAKGARKPSSKKASSIEIGNYVETKIIDGYAVPILQDIKTLNEYKQWKKNIESITSLQFIFEIVNFFCYEETSENQLYISLKDTLDSESSDYIFLTGIFLLHILNVTGHTPLEVQEESDSNNSRITKTQMFIIKTNIQNALRVNLSLEEKKKMLKLHVEWVEEVVERNLKSKQILYSILKI